MTGRRRPRRRPQSPSQGDEDIATPLTDGVATSSSPFQKPFPMAMRTSPPRILSKRGQCQDSPTPISTSLTAGDNSGRSLTQRRSPGPEGRKTIAHGVSRGFSQSWKIKPQRGERRPLPARRQPDLFPRRNAANGESPAVEQSGTLGQPIPRYLAPTGRTVTTRALFRVPFQATENVVWRGPRGSTPYWLSPFAPSGHGLGTPRIWLLATGNSSTPLTLSEIPRNPS
jgi:hypothetical protein